MHALMCNLVIAGYAVDFLPDDNCDAGAYTDGLIEAGIGIAGQVSSPPAWLLGHYQSYAAIVVSRYHLANAWIPLLKRLPNRPRIVFDTVDLHHLREMREAYILGNPSLARAAQRTRQLELKAIRDADTTWVVSTIEKQALLQEMPGLRIECIPNLHKPISSVAPCEERQGLLFVGSGRHPPNHDAVAWFIRDIFPRIRNHLPGCQLHVVGEDLDTAYPAVPDVVIHGYVADMAPLLARCRLGVAPLRFGAGVKGKVNQYMAHGLPVVATPCATEGMHLSHGIDVLEAETASDFAASIVHAYTESELWQRLSAGGLDNIRQNFTFDAVLPAIQRTFGHARTPV
jgi:glycosyltransferase involved in cell wall biosynthesis